MSGFWLRVLRVLSLLDGASFIYLLFHAIYSKRIMGHEEAIETPGMIHGVVFCGLLAALFAAALQCKWSWWRAAQVFICALIPFAPFVLEFSLKKEQESIARAVDSVGDA